jgi:pilus assembly protein Flp/PilA
MTGYVYSQKIDGKPLTAQQFRDTIVCPKLPAMLKCSDIYVDVAAFAPSPTAYDGYVNTTNSGLKTPKLDTTNGYCIGTKDRPYVVLRIAYPAPVLTTSLIYPNTVTYKGRKSRLLTSVAAFKNEPFKNEATGC